MDVELIGGPKDGFRVAVKEGVDLVSIPVLTSDPPAVKKVYKNTERATFRQAIYRRDVEREGRFNFDGYR